MEEIWKDIQGYEGLYQISNLGNVKSLNYCGRRYQQVLVPKCNNSGRLWVELRNNGKKKPMLIHRLVGMAFIPNPNNYPQINHIDENPKNNRVDNLEWCTGLQNVQKYMNNHPELKSKRKHTPKISNHMEERILQVSKDGKVVQEWDNPISIVHKNNWNEWSIIQCCKGKRNTAYGYVWRYAGLIYPSREGR